MLSIPRVLTYACSTERLISTQKRLTFGLTLNRYSLQETPQPALRQFMPSLKIVFSSASFAAPRRAWKRGSYSSRSASELPSMRNDSDFQKSS
jgi:hypothetical protein